MRITVYGKPNIGIFKDYLADFNDQPRPASYKPVVFSGLFQGVSTSFLPTLWSGTIPGLSVWLSYATGPLPMLNYRFQRGCASEGVEKRVPSYTIGGNINWYSQQEEWYEVSL